jgi:serine/threonine protein kinase/Tol biopolymer transport system component
LENKKLGHYEILELLGRGGMGEVYRARDTRLGREVAIKVLPESIAQNEEVQARFEREARTISSLNHPNICVLHDVGQDGDTRFLVMELVEGVTLEEKLRGGPLPLEEVFRYGAQIADALDRAHREGVVHRDLKPGNVMITRRGAKLMDFGLARVGGLLSGTSDVTLAASPTVANPLTQQGAIVGTFQYMAPEQLEGQEVDHRGDLWALGCVLYEMATGQRAFEGNTQASLIGAIMHTQPELVSQRVAVAPVEFDRIVSSCLVKDPQDRAQSAHDIKLQLEWLLNGPPSSSMAAPAPEIPRKPRRGWGRLALAGLVGVLVGASAIWLTQDRKVEVRDEKPTRYTLGRWPIRPNATPVWTVDGRSVVFAIRQGLESKIYMRDLDAFETRQVEGTDGGFAPFVSPDGRWIGFLTDDTVSKVPIGGGVPQMIAKISNINSADWGVDGYVYLSPGSGGETGDVAIYRVPQDGGEPEVFGRLKSDGTEGGVWLPEALPDGKTVLITVLGAQTRIVAFRAGGERHDVLTGGFLGRYVEPGYLLYQDQSSQSTAAVPFDATEARVTGGPLLVTEQIDGSYCFDATDKGRIVYVPAPTEGEGRYLTWVDRDGRSEVAVDVQGSWVQPRISPDGQKVLVRKTGAECELWMLDLQRGSFARVVQGDDNHSPLWAPDGRRILFDRQEEGQIVTLDVTGSRRMEVIAKGANRGNPESWSAGGNLFAYTVSGEGGRPDIWVRHMGDDSDPEPFAVTPQAEDSPRISPDGKWIAYTGVETGVPEVYVRSYPDDSSAWQVSAGGGNNPLWSRDGKELYFIRVRDSALMAAQVEAGAEFSLGAPRKILDRVLSTSRIGNFDVGPDGRFITVSGEGGDTDQRPIRVVDNWLALVHELSGK